jgi:3'(2'), 5'-bisphosphate nucleotidase
MTPVAPDCQLGPRERDSLAEGLAHLVFDAGRVVIDLYEKGCERRSKSDESPVSEADERAETIILDRLDRQFPGIPVIAEEAVARGHIPTVTDRFFLVDPLDGTREFFKRNGEFTVNIALVLGGCPIAGAIYAPALGQLWAAGARAFSCKAAPADRLPRSSTWRAVSTRPATASELIAVESRSHSDPHTEAFLKRLQPQRRSVVGSSIKFCLIAEGRADVYPRFSTTMEWDTAAGDAVLQAAGGIMRACDGGPFVYGKVDQGFRNGGFIAWGDPHCAIFDGTETVS